MIKNFIRRYSVGIAVVSLAVVSLSAVAYASHSWGGYHWARASNPFTLKLGDNVSTTWDAYLNSASSDWSASSVLDTAVVAGQSRKNCRATLGRVEVCNSKYGNNGWLGIAQIWASGTHIVQGTAKLNDTYFNTPKYNTAPWKNMVVCQEIAHTFGLDHQDENFTNANLGTCMDYTNDPDGSIFGQLSNEHPNQHDFEELGIIYSHLDSTSTLSQSSQTTLQGNPEIDHSDPSSWGKEVRKSSDGRGSVFERDLGNKNKVFTFVVWAKE